MEQNDSLLNSQQLAALKSLLHSGSAEASQALAQWIGKPSLIEIEMVEQLPLEEATSVLANQQEPICFCSAEMQGSLTGEVILAFDDASGLALADMLLNQPPGTSDIWDDMATSAALETTNILCCAYLNAIQHHITQFVSEHSLLPTPPRFNRDFAESLLEFALMGQAIASDQVLLARTRFEIDDTRINWTLLFVPDAPSMARLAEILQHVEKQQGNA